MRTHFRAAPVAAAMLIVCLSCGATETPLEQRQAEVKSELESLDTWLKAGPNAAGWEAYLNLPALRAELGKGDPADAAALDGVVKQLDSGAPGLELAPFRKLRDALSSWSTELVVSKAPSLPEALSSFESRFQPVGISSVANAKSALQSAAAKLDRFLNASGANGSAWKEYLRWQDLEAQLAAEKPDVKTLHAIAQLYFANQPGLEMPVYAAVGDAIDEYANRLEAEREDLRASFVEQLKGLAGELKQYVAGYTQDLAEAVGSRLGWLQSMGQIESVVKLVRQRYSRPNLLASGTARLVAAGIAQQVDDTAPVHDVILGTDISGTARTVGNVALRLIPSDDKALFETTLIGTARSRTVGYNGPATIHSQGTTQINGSKRILIDENGFAVYPATATAKTTTRITGVSAGGNLVTRIATNRVYDSKGEAEYIAGQHAAALARKRVDGQANTQLGKAHASFLEKFRNPLLRKREFPQLMKFSTTEDRLSLVSLQANRSQLGSPDAPPPINVENDLAVQAHESYINALAGALLSGVTLKQEEVEGKLIEMRGSVPEQLKSDEARDPWAITMASTKPIIIKFADNGFRFVFRGQRYTAGDLAIRAMYVAVDYKAEINGNGAKLVRQGELEIFPFGFVKGKDTLKAREIGWREKLRKRFGKIFEPEIKSEGLVLPGKWREAGRLDLKQLQLAGGWAALAWIESGEPAPPADKKSEDKVADSAR